MTYVIGQPCVEMMNGDASRSVRWTAFTRAAGVSTSILMSVWTAGRAMCPVEAIYYEDDLPEDLIAYLADNERFFAQPFDGRAEPLGSPGGATKLGALGADTQLVAGLPSQGE